MRVTGGIYGGRRLEPPKDSRIRPTSDKVRQAVFNILESRGLVEGAVVLDAFCGTGALGIEALSRGALCCTFMDKSLGSLDLCRRNFAALKIDAQHSFVLKDATRPGSRGDPIPAANLVFFDPPYALGLIETALAALSDEGWIAPPACALIESEKNWNGAVLATLGYEILLRRDYGDTAITLAQKL